MTQIAIIADIHGNLPALEAVAADIAAHGIARVVNLGDHASGPLWPCETLEVLMRQSWVSIAGNHDRQVAFDDPASHGASDRYALAQLTSDQKQWLAALPQTTSIDNGDILLCHGTPASDRRYLLETPEDGRLRLASPTEVNVRLEETTSRIVACAHSHIPRLVHARRGVTVVNPGSVGLPAYEDDGPDPHVSETGSPMARYAIIDSKGQPLRVTFVAIQYDFGAAVRKATANGRADWAGALRTGYAARDREQGGVGCSAP
jgi:predicted phosphodiesterase